MKRKIVKCLAVSLALCAAVSMAACSNGNDNNQLPPGGEKLHEYGNDNICDECGYIDMSKKTADAALAEYGFYHIDKDDSETYSTGDNIYFGSYPQSLVSDADLTSKLSAQAGELPTSESHGEWVSYGYYAEGESSDYMFYKDVTVSGKQYRGVYLLGYRPYYSRLDTSGDYSYIDDSGIELETVYWYAYEPIIWNVLSYDEDSGDFLLNSKYCLDAQPFQDVYEKSGDDLVIPDTDTPINDWEASSIRRFLNESFYDTAFFGASSAMVKPSMLDNKTTGYAADAPYQINQNNTTDKVFLLSNKDLTDTDYGYTGKGVSRSRSFTDYSSVQGLRPSSQGNTADGDPACYYLTRSAGTVSYSITGISKLGAVSPAGAEDINSTESIDGLAYNGDFGVLPAICFNPDNMWVDSEYAYTDADGNAKTMEYGVYIPKSYKSGDRLPLITYIPDSSYVGKPLTAYELGACPQGWITDENMSENPAFFLTMKFTVANSDVTVEGSEAAQIVDIIDSVVDKYGIDTDRLYLTGQSMGGIADFSINGKYPEKFAATVYVGCQPGDEVGDDMYNALIEQAAFANQKFVYIASRKDEKAPYGQDAVENVLQRLEKSYIRLYDLDHKDKTALNMAIKTELDKGGERYLFGYTQLTSNGNPGNEHMQSFAPSYAINSIFEWLMAQKLD